MGVKISQPLIDSSSQVLLQSQTDPRINDKAVVATGLKDHDLNEAPVITIIRMMEIGKNVDIKI